MSDRYFVHDQLNGDIEYCETLEEAIKYAKQIVSDCSDDGFPEEILNGGIKIGIVTHESGKVNERPVDKDEFGRPLHPEWSFMCDVEMLGVNLK